MQRERERLHLRRPRKPDIPLFAVELPVLEMKQKFGRHYWFFYLPRAPKALIDRDWLDKLEGKIKL